MNDATPPLEHPDAPDLLHGGMLYRLMHRFGVEPEHAARAARRAILVGLLLWIPMAVAAFVEGRALPGRVDVPFLFDVAAYVRPLLAVPLMLAAEPIFAAAWKEAGGKFRSRGLVGPDCVAAYDALVRKGTRTARNPVPELLCLAVAGALAVRLVTAVVSGAHDTWFAVAASSETSRLTVAGAWYAYAVHGVLFYLFLRWLWLLSVWYRFLLGVARLPLHLFPAHADRAAGLGFIGKTIGAAAPLAVAWSAALASVAANHMIHFHERLPDFAPLGVALLVFVLLVFVLPPVVVFVPLLVRTRRQALESWSRRMARFAEGGPAAGPATEVGGDVGAPDLGLEDLAIAVEAVHAMRPVPIGLGPLVGLVAAVAVPVVPLLFLAFPAHEILGRLAKLVI